MQEIEGEINVLYICNFYIRTNIIAFFRNKVDGISKKEKRRIRLEEIEVTRNISSQCLLRPPRRPQHAVSISSEDSGDSESDSESESEDDISDLLDLKSLTNDLGDLTPPDYPSFGLQCLHNSTCTGSCGGSWNSQDVAEEDRELVTIEHHHDTTKRILEMKIECQSLKRGFLANFDDSRSTIERISFCSTHIRAVKVYVHRACVDASVDRRNRRTQFNNAREKYKYSSEMMLSSYEEESFDYICDGIHDSIERSRSLKRGDNLISEHALSSDNLYQLIWGSLATPLFERAMELNSEASCDDFTSHDDFWAVLVEIMQCCCERCLVTETMRRLVVGFEDIIRMMSSLPIVITMKNFEGQNRKKRLANGVVETIKNLASAPR